MNFIPLKRTKTEYRFYIVKVYTRNNIGRDFGRGEPMCSPIARNGRTHRFAPTISPRQD